VCRWKTVMLKWERSSTHTQTQVCRADEWTAYAPTRPFTIHTLAPERSHTHTDTHLVRSATSLEMAAGCPMPLGVTPGKRSEVSCAASGCTHQGRQTAQQERGDGPRVRQCITATTHVAVPNLSSSHAHCRRQGGRGDPPQRSTLSTKRRTGCSGRSWACPSSTHPRCTGDSHDSQRGSGRAAVQ
jgi:hypothetical protein